MTGGATLELRDVFAEYVPGQPVLNGLTISPAPGEVFVIIGPNGSGKSTSLKVMAGFLKPSAGEVLLRVDAQNTDLTKQPTRVRSGAGVAYLPQGHSVFPSMTVHENLLLGGWSARRARRTVAAAVAAMYERYPALVPKRDVPAGTLSGGQQRILELGRALVSDPRVLLVDEPSAGVAPAVAEVMYRELSALRQEGRTIILVDQDVRAALAIADTVCVLRSGRIDRIGAAAGFGTDLDGLVREWLAVDAPPDPAAARSPLVADGEV